MRRILVAVALLGGCATLDVPSHSSLKPIDGKEKDGRILFEEQHVRFTRGDGGAPIAVKTTTTHAQILGESGQYLRELSVVDGRFSTLEDAIVTARFPDGKTKTWGKESAEVLPAFPGFVLYADARKHVIRPPPVPKHSVVGTWSRVVTRSPELFLFAWWLGSSVPVEKTRFVVEADQGLEIEFLGERLDEPTELAPVVEDLGDRTRYTWERSDVPRPRDITRGLGLAQHEGVWVRLKSWTGADGAPVSAPADAAQLSRFVAELYKDRATPSPELAATTQKILAGVEDNPRAKARRLYAWVRDNIRYCAVSLGMGGWVPHEAADVHRLRYGDCKDKANLLRTMLKTVGIESRVALVYADDWPVRFRLPVLAANFNHAILIVDLPEGPVVVDPTSRTVPFGDLPDVDEDRLILPVSHDGAALMPAPASSIERDVRIEEYDLTLKENGELFGAFSSTMNGAYADRARALLLHTPRGRHHKVATSEIAIFNPKVKDLIVENAAPPEEVTPLTMRGSCTVKHARGGIGQGDIVLRASAWFAPVFPAVEDDDGRPGPFLLGHSRTTTETVRVALPRGVQATLLPEPIEAKTVFGSFSLRWTRSDDGKIVTLTRASTITTRVIRESDVRAYRAFAEQARAADDLPVAIVREES